MLRGLTSIKVGDLSQAVAPQLQAVGGKPQAIVTRVEGALAVVRRPVTTQQDKKGLFTTVLGLPWVQCNSTSAFTAVRPS